MPANLEFRVWTIVPTLRVLNINTPVLLPITRQIVVSVHLQVIRNFVSVDSHLNFLAIAAQRNVPVVKNFYLVVVCHLL